MRVQANINSLKAFALNHDVLCEKLAFCSFQENKWKIKKSDIITMMDGELEIVNN